MAPPTALPDPTFGQPPESCLSCGYSLEGTPEGARCPECGIPTPQPGQSLVVCGVARSTETKVWRRWVWGFIFAGSFIYAQLVPFMVFQTPFYTAILFAVIVAAVIGMLATGSSRKRGTERFTFTPSGYARVGYDSGAMPEFIPWPERVEYEVRRVSSVWQRLRLYDCSLGKRRIILDAGIRCTDEDRELIASTLDEMIGPQREQSAASTPTRGAEGTSDV